MSHSAFLQGAPVLSRTGLGENPRSRIQGTMRQTCLQHFEGTVTSRRRTHPLWREIPARAGCMAAQVDRRVVAEKMTPRESLGITAARTLVFVFRRIQAKIAANVLYVAQGHGCIHRSLGDDGFDCAGSVPVR